MHQAVTLCPVCILYAPQVFTFNSPFGGEMWSLRSDYASGDLGFDPMGLKPCARPVQKGR